MTPSTAGGPVFTDLHVHLIPGIDDGPRDMDESLEMCADMVRQGVRTATATPHLSHTWPKNTAKLIRERLAELRSALAGAGIPLDVLAGADIRVDSDFLDRWRHGELISVADRNRAILLELPDNVAFPLADLSFQLRLKRVMPILTHPERCEPLQRDFTTLREWVEQGMLLQITTGSLLGEFGERSRQAAVDMVQAGLVAFFASDAHGPKRRPPNHLAAYNRITEMWGGEAADLLMVENPARILEGKPVEPVTVQSPEPPPRKSFWSKIFGG